MNGNGPDVRVIMIVVGLYFAYDGFQRGNTSARLKSEGVVVTGKVSGHHTTTGRKRAMRFFLDADYETKASEPRYSFQFPSRRHLRSMPMGLTSGSAIFRPTRERLRSRVWKVTAGKRGAVTRVLRSARWARYRTLGVLEAGLRSRPAARAVFRYGQRSVAWVPRGSCRTIRINLGYPARVQGTEPRGHPNFGPRTQHLVKCALIRVLRRLHVAILDRARGRSPASLRRRRRMFGSGRSRSGCRRSRG